MNQDQRIQNCIQDPEWDCPLEEKSRSHWVSQTQVRLINKLIVIFGIIKIVPWRHG